MDACGRNAGVCESMGGLRGLGKQNWRRARQETEATAAPALNGPVKRFTSHPASKSQACGLASRSNPALLPCCLCTLRLCWRMRLGHVTARVPTHPCPQMGMASPPPSAYLTYDHGRATALVRGQPLVLHGLLKAHIANLARHTLLFMTMGHAARHQSATAALAMPHHHSPAMCPGSTAHGSLSMQTVPTLSWDRGRPSAGTALKTCASGEPAER